MSRLILAEIILLCAIITGICMNFSIAESNKCLVYEPTPTPIPYQVQYSQWMPYPGYGPWMGKGWIRIRDYNHVVQGLIKLKYVDVLTDEEYNLIGRLHGLKISRYGRIVYGFPPVKGFSNQYPVLQNKWLPKRLKN